MGNEMVVGGKLSGRGGTLMRPIYSAIFFQLNQLTRQRDVPVVIWSLSFSTSDFYFRLLGVKLEASDLLLWMMTYEWSRRRVGVGCHVSFRVLRAAGTSPGSPVINNVKAPEVSHSERLPWVHHIHSYNWLCTC